LKSNDILFSPCDEAEIFVLQHDFMHLSFYKDDFREFVDTLAAAQRAIDKRESPQSGTTGVTDQSRKLLM
jgi:hypothetical protein